MYNLTALDAALRNSVFAGKVHFWPLTDSTNNDAMKMARAGAAHGTVCLADAQSAGRGRGGHAWESRAGEGLYVSVVLRPGVPQQRWPLIPLCAGLAAMDAIEAAAGVRADLRWPNDVLVGPKKVCGILVEAGMDDAGAAFAVAGIGINVHQRGFEGEVAALATSLDVEAGRTVSRQMLLVCLLESLQRETDGLAAEEAARQIPARVAGASTWICGRRVEVHGPQACAGVTAGLDECGFLLVETAGGTVRVQTGGIRAAETK
ncbi:MAG: biotin--[acetyl-CoA-carboxylase] ligase [Terracidiphilus sp.]|nr:biotin--[acetyl-CoA-carboxylase] ligase [Terracidiphilus sp.]